MNSQYQLKLKSEETGEIYSFDSADGLNSKKSFRDEDTVNFLVEYKGDRAGEISLGGLEKDYRKSEFGISIHPNYHGQGVGSTAVHLLAKYAFETLNRHKLRGGYIEGNEASRKIQEKAGLRKEGRERHYKYIDGEWKDVVWMSILENEYFEMT